MRRLPLVLALSWLACGRTGLGNDEPKGPVGNPMQPVEKESCGAVSCGRALSLGLGHGCALVNQVAWCWGSNTEGQLGLPPDMTDHPARAVPTDLRFVNVVAASFHTCGLTAAGDVWCWGSNRFGQLGDGTLHQPMAASSPTPVKVPGIPAAASLEVGEVKTCALTGSGDRWCWGGFEGRHPPTRVSAPSFDAFLFSHGCRVTATGGVQCWGSNSGGQLGVTTSGTESRQLSDVPGLPGRVSDVVTPMGASCALIESGDVWCWGTWEGMDKQPPARVEGFDGVTTLRSGYIATCGRDEGGHVGCVSAKGPRKALAFPYGDITDFNVGAWQACVLRSNHEVWCLLDSTASTFDAQKVASLPASN